ncbi:hypothetical protein J4435_05460 [Candidatus Woesearchaeota archaeon]|nr:hypothetical protein [Candidatus Woesearchaeota archaeon]
MLQPSYSACSKVIAALGHGNRPHLVAAYHAATTTAQEKACAVEEAMGLGRLPRGEYGIVKSLVLTHPGAERPFLCAYDSSDKLDFRVIGGALHAPSRVYAYPRERLEQLVGVSAGALPSWKLLISAGTRCGTFRCPSVHPCWPTQEMSMTPFVRLTAGNTPN